MKQSNSTRKQWAIFYQSPTGETYGCNTKLGCAYLSSETVNVYCDQDTLQEVYNQTIAYTKRTEQGKEGYAAYEGWLKPEYRNGKVFIARVGSDNFPATLTEEPKWQNLHSHEDKTEQVALRVPCKIKTV